MKYYFILGRNPKLSQAEVEAVLEFQELRVKNKELCDKVLIIEVKEALDIDKLNHQLGGTVKIGKIIDEIESFTNFQDNFCKLIKCEEGKVHFGFSLYDLNSGKKLRKIQQKLKPVAMEIKRKLREEKNLNSRWVVSKEIELSSVIVKKNQLLKYGSEICFFLKEQEILVGQTLAVQPFEEFGERDYNRPGRDSVSGMIPPKLAKIMINLAQLEKDNIILDPFCGSGTILQEAILMGYTGIRGCDNSEKAVEDSKKNLEWLKEKYEVRSMKYEVDMLDVNVLSKKIKLNSIDAIITEPYLGPPLHGNESEFQLDKNAKELEELYNKAFEEFYKILKKNGKVVIVIPEFRIKNTIKELNLFNIKGFKVINDNKLMYGRPDQHVWRNIVIFKKE